jgi:hypothetical protein
MRTYTGAAGTAAPQQQCNPVHLARRCMRIHPHKQSCAVSMVSCVHTQKQLVPLLLSNDVDRYSLSVTIYVPVRAVSRSLCGAMRTYTGAVFAAAPQRRRSPARLTSRQQRRRPVQLVRHHLCTYTSSCALSLWRHAYIHLSSFRCSSSTTTQPGTAAAWSAGGHTPIHAALLSVVSCVHAYTGAACAANPQRRRNS